MKLQRELLKKFVLSTQQRGCIFEAFEAWRSPVAHSAGGRGVAGSNPVASTRFNIHLEYVPFDWDIFSSTCKQVLP